MKHGPGPPPLLPTLGPPAADPRERLAETIRALERGEYGAGSKQPPGAQDQVGAWAERPVHA